MNPSIMRLVPRDGDDAAVESDLPLLPLSIAWRPMPGGPSSRPAAGWSASNAPTAPGEPDGRRNRCRASTSWCWPSWAKPIRRAAGAARSLIQTQLPTGAGRDTRAARWRSSASVQAYFALKLTGQEPHTEPMQRAREAILAAGGADGADAVTHDYLAMLGKSLTSR